MKGKPGTCGVCEHSQVDEIDQLLIELDANKLKCPWCPREFNTYQARNSHERYCGQRDGQKPMTWESVGERFGLSRNTLRTHFQEHIGQVKPKSVGTPKELLGPTTMTVQRADEIAAAISGGWR